MLPTTPLHQQIARGCGKPLVVTSGNSRAIRWHSTPTSRSASLCGIADAWLHHDRSIVRPIDDSVIRVIAGQPGDHALGSRTGAVAAGLKRPPMLALGGHQKAAIALCNGAQSVFGPHIGDLETEAARVRYLDQIEAHVPNCTALDPNYWFVTSIPTTSPADGPLNKCSPDWPCNIIMRTSRRRCSSKVGWAAKCSGVAWDGTGYGPDGTIWGGEFLVATATDYSPCRPFASVRVSWRRMPRCASRGAWRWHSSSKRLEEQQRPNCVSRASIRERSSSLCGCSAQAAALAADFECRPTLRRNCRTGLEHRHTAQFEGQPAMLLEAACDTSFDGEYPLPFHAESSSTLDWRPLVRGVLEDRSGGLARGRNRHAVSSCLGGRHCRRCRTVFRSACRAVWRLLSATSADRTGCGTIWSRSAAGHAWRHSLRRRRFGGRTIGDRGGANRGRLAAMCLAIPGKVVRWVDTRSALAVAEVEFGA